MKITRLPALKMREAEPITMKTGQNVCPVHPGCTHTFVHE